MTSPGDELEPRGPVRAAIDVAPIGDDLVMVTVHDEIDLRESAELRAVLNDACTGPHRSVAVDLRDVHFIGSSGMGVLAEVHDRLDAEGRRLLVLEPAEVIRQAFVMAGLPHILDLDDR
jgi:anti-anti-sigma factor